MPGVRDRVISTGPLPWKHHPVETELDRQSYSETRGTQHHPGRQVPYHQCSHVMNAVSPGEGGSCRQIHFRTTKPASITQPTRTCVRKAKRCPLTAQQGALRPGTQIPCHDSGLPHRDPLQTNPRPWCHPRRVQWAGDELVSALRSIRSVNAKNASRVCRAGGSSPPANPRLWLRTPPANSTVLT